ncbi:hypothetical protein YC2023_043135 [Brassica napus]
MSSSMVQPLIILLDPDQRASAGMNFQKQNNSDSPLSFINFTTTTINYPIQHKLRPRRQNQSNIILIIMIISVIFFISGLFLFTPPEETKEITSTKGLKVVSIVLQE